MTEFAVIGLINRNVKHQSSLGNYNQFQLTAVGARRYLAETRFGSGPNIPAGGKNGPGADEIFAALPPFLSERETGAGAKRRDQFGIYSQSSV